MKKNTASAADKESAGREETPAAASDSRTPDSVETEEVDVPEAEAEVELDPVAKLGAEVQEWRDRALRNQADLENYRKRMAREKSDAILYSNAGLLQSLLPILENFEMGLQAARAEGEGSVIYQGMAMVKKQLEEFLREEGVETIATAGEEFDPNRHEAVHQEFSEDVPEGVIISELRKGYRLRDRLLRAANVVISKGPKTEAEPKSRTVEVETDA